MLAFQASAFDHSATSPRAGGGPFSRGRPGIPSQSDGHHVLEKGSERIELTLVRHGATEWNAAGRYQGQSDIELSELGRKQARAIAHRLRSEPIERIYSSDLKRARATAEAIAAEHGLPVETDPRLREFHFGEWEGLTWAEITVRHPEMLDATDIVAAYKPPGGETLPDLIRRWEDFHAGLRRNDRQRVVVVTHAGMLHAIVRSLEPRGAEEAIGGRFRFLPASLTRLRFDENGVEALALSDAGHLVERSLL